MTMKSLSQAEGFPSMLKVHNHSKKSDAAVGLRDLMTIQAVATGGKVC